MTFPQTPALKIARIETRVYRAPIHTPVRTSFGVMKDRPALLVRVEDRNGAVGWGETWCNFPTVGAEHRARLIDSFLAPLVVEGEWQSPALAFAHLSAQARILAIQTGEPGPLAQAIAGIDIALWDLAGRLAGEPLWRLLGGRGPGTVATYASGLNPEEAPLLARERYEDGYRAFKLKIGFGSDRDVSALGALRAEVGAATPLMVDANQAWDCGQALAMSQALAPFEPQWLEEPIPADSPREDWARLAELSPIPLAGGENLRGEAEFEAVIEGGALRVIQPDVSKWGGISGCLPLARRIVAAGRRYCPHYLGGGIGLLASAHLLAAAGGDGLLEVDANPNPLREGLAMPFPAHAEGHLTLPEGAGLGVEPDLAALEAFQIRI